MQAFSKARLRRIRVLSFITCMILAALFCTSLLCRMTGHEEQDFRRRKFTWKDGVILATQFRVLPGNETTASMNGLGISIGKMKRHRDSLSFTVMLAYEDRAHKWIFFREPVLSNVFFYDSAGTPLEGRLTLTLTLDPQFIREEKAVFKQSCECRLPDDAEFISIELGRSGLATRMVEVPEKEE
jgi:hypothetical protein